MWKWFKKWFWPEKSTSSSSDASSVLAVSGASNRCTVSSEGDPSISKRNIEEKKVDLYDTDTLNHDPIRTETFPTSSLDNAITHSMNSQDPAVEVNFRVLIHLDNFDKTKDKCFIRAGKPLSDFKADIVEMMPVKNFKCGSTDFVSLEGHLPISQRFAAKSIQYKYVVIRSGKVCWEQFRESKHGNRELEIRSDQETYHVYDDVIFTGKSPCAPNVVRGIAMREFLPSFDDLCELPISDALLKCGLILESYRQEKYLIGDDFRNIYGREFSFEESIGAYISQILKDIKCQTVYQNQFKISVFICIFANKENNAFWDVGWTNFIFSVLREYLVLSVTDECSKFEELLPTDELKKLFYDGLNDLVCQYIHLSSKGENTGDCNNSDYATWLFALYFLEKVSPNDTTKIQEELVSMWQTSVNRNFVGNGRNTLTVLMKLNITTLSFTFLKICSMQDFYFIINESNMLNFFHSADVLQKFLHNSTKNQKESISILSKHLKSVTSCTDITQWMTCIEEYVSEVQTEDAQNMEVMLFIADIVSNISEKLIRSGENTPLASEVQTFQKVVLSKILSKLRFKSFNNLTDVVSNYSQLSFHFESIYSCKDDIKSQFVGGLNNNTSEDCMEVCINLSFSLHSDISQILVDKIFENFTESPNKNKFLQFFHDQLAKFKNKTQLDNLAHFVSQIISMIAIPVHVNQESCVPTLSVITESANLTSILRFIPYLENKLPHEIKCRLQLIKENVCSFFNMLETGQLTVKTVLGLKDDNCRSRLIELALFFMKKDQTQLINMRIQEFNIYQEEKDVVAQFLTFFKSESKVSLVEEETKMRDFSSMNHTINSVFNLSHEFSSFQCKDSSSIPFSRIDFETMNEFRRYKKSSCFLAFCRQKLLDFSKELNMETNENIIYFDDIIGLCRNIFQNFNSFLKTICDGTVKLRLIKALFLEMYKSKNIPDELSILDLFCEGNLHSDKIYLQIKIFFDTEHYIEIAKITHKVLRLLQITERYSVVNYILHSVKNEEQFLDQTLSSVDNELIENCDIFSQFSHSVTKALKIFFSCKKLVKWMLANVKSIQEFKVFIDLANIYAGETDIEVDRVLCLQAAVVAYSAFFFELRKNPTFNNFLAACKILNNSLDRDADVTQKLLDSNQHIRWIKSINERHGSVEASSLKMVQLINETGIYKVGLSSIKPPVSYVKLQYDSVSSDEIHEADIYRREIFLEELKELESKLMLISVAESQKESVNRFTESLHKVSSIANHLRSLIEHGCHMFSRWVLTCYMKNNKKVVLCVDFGYESISGTGTLNSDLIDVENFLHKCKTAWTDHMGLLRNEFPSLNNFTTSQLVRLSILLAKFRYEDIKKWNREIRMLIQLIAPQTNVNELLIALQDRIQSTDQHEIVNTGVHLPPYKSNVDSELVQSATNVEIFDLNSCDVNDLNAEYEDNSENFSTGENQLEHLNDFIDNIVESYDFSLNFVRKAVKQTGETKSEDVVVNWCLRHFDDEEEEDDEEKTSYNVDDSDLQNEHIANILGDEGSTVVDCDQILVNFVLPVQIQQLNTLLSSLEAIWNNFLLSVDEMDVRDFINFKTLASVLHILTDKFSRNICRELPPYFKKGVPNLVVCNTKELHALVVSLYQFDKNKPLPSLDEILICNFQTSREDVELHCLRAFHDTTGRIFSVLHADKLDFDTSCFLERLCMNTEASRFCQLVFFSNKENDEHSFISSAFDQYRATLPKISVEDLRFYLRNHLECVSSSMKDFPMLTIVASQRPGCGKSLTVNRISQTLGGEINSHALHREYIDQGRIINSWTASSNDTVVYHLDITNVVSDSCDDLLFCLAVCGGLTDSVGNIWKCSQSHVYLLEITMLVQKQEDEHVQFKHLLPTIWCASPQETFEVYRENFKFPTSAQTEIGCVYYMDEIIFESEHIQRPYQYLVNCIDSYSLNNFVYTEPDYNKFQCLSTLLEYCCVKDPTWSELLNFCRFLNVQLKSSEMSVFCDSNLVGDALPGFKNFVVKFLIRMSKDFATRSVQISDRSVVVPEITERIRWENNPHPYIFFNEDGMTLSLFGFQIENLNLIDERNNEILDENFISQELYTGLCDQGVNFNKAATMSQRDLRQYYVDQLCVIFGITDNSNFDMESNFYELTSDNVLKMLAIQMRFRARIPVIIMGETGTGKTRLIRFICDLQRQNKSEKNLIILKCHGGVTDEKVFSTVHKAIRLAEVNTSKGVNQTILFFDEANTTTAIGAIKEVIADGLVDGKPIPINTGLQFIAAVNPYRKHSHEMIAKLEKAGLGYHMKPEETSDTLGKIPMRQLVYRVKEMPWSLFPFIWDFGVLDKVSERKYITQMVQHHISQFGWPPTIEHLLVDALTCSQEFMRLQKDECSFVSLRDVERALLVLTWFKQKSNIILTRIQSKLSMRLPEATTSFIYYIVWAFGVAYLVRLENRAAYLDLLSKCFYGYIHFPLGSNMFDIIEACQNLFVSELELEKDISLNAALKENIWLMAICIELRLPLFLVGKPGSSKSLSKTVVTHVMQGENSYSTLFKQMKEVQIVSFQCSPLATAEGIRSTFAQCQKFQEKQDLRLFTSVVVLDEVGLAEDSPSMPLKTLHPLLEDGCIDDEEQPKPYKKVAFIGISNWALDPAKMNRAVFVSRGKPDADDLKETARKMYSSDDTCSILDLYIDGLVEGYCCVCDLQKREYFGLRDFYSLVKMLLKICQRQRKITPFDIVSSIERCFGGCFESFVPTNVFLSKMDLPYNQPTSTCDSNKELIMRCLMDIEESRYLLFMTKNNAALRVLQEYPSLTKSENASVIFGSSFPKDQEYSHLCQNINKIKIAMELGRTVILCNLTNLYESLYDALNQNYVYFGGSRYVDLGLGTHRVKCRVHHNFKLIVVAEDVDVYEKFPIPLINRLEKHFLGMQTLLSHEQVQLVKVLKQWVENFSSTNNSHYAPQDVFIGYHDDVPALIVYRISTASHPTPLGFQDILLQAKDLMIKCATPDAISRLTNSRLILEDCNDIYVTYHTLQHHDCLYDFLKNSFEESHASLLIQVTTHCRLLTGLAKDDLGRQLDLLPGKLQLVSLQQIDSEEQFSKKIDIFLNNCNNNPKENVLLVQCDLGLDNQNEGLLDCARYCIEDKLNQYKSAKFTIVFLIHLPRISGGNLKGFPGTLWNCVHIDEILKSSHHVNMMSIEKKSMSTLIVEDDKLFDELLKECLPKALSQIFNKKRNQDPATIKRIAAIFKSTNSLSLKLVSVLKEKIVKLLINYEEGLYSDNWLLSIASESIDLKEGCTFQQAVWLHLVKTIVPHLKNLLLFCNLDGGLDIVSLKLSDSLENNIFLDYFIETLSHIELNGTLFNLTEILECSHLPEDFTSQIPFSWLYMILFDKIIQKLGHKTSSETLKSALSSNGMYSILERFCDNNKEHILMFLQDSTIVKIKHQFDSARFSKLVANTIFSVIENAYTLLQNQLLNQEHETVLVVNDLSISLMVAYRCFSENQFRIIFFGELVDLNPAIFQKIEASVSFNSCGFTLDICAITVMLEHLLPDPKKLGEFSQQQKWMNLVGLVIHHITSYFNWIESDTVTYPQELVEFAKNKKTSLSHLEILKLFFTFVLPPDLPMEIRKCVLTSVKLLTFCLKDGNVKTKSIFDKLVTVLTKISGKSSLLNFCGGVESCFICHESFRDPVALRCKHVACFDCIDDVKNTRIVASNNGNWCCPFDKCREMYEKNYKLVETKECSEAVQNHKYLRKLLNIFFIEILQRYVFTEDCVPEKEIVETLLEFVVTQNLGKRPRQVTKEISPFNGDYIDDAPVVRSFILQLILRCHWDHAQKYLESFLQSQREFISNESLLIDLCSLIVYSLEDFFLSEKSGTSLQKTVNITQKRLLSNSKIDFDASNILEGLRFIAETRIDLTILADVLYRCIIDKQSGSAETSLFDSAENLMSSCNNDHMKYFLVRVMSYKYRINSISEWKSTNIALNLLPKSLQVAQLHYVQDDFLVCGDQYLDVRKVLRTALFDKNLEPVKKIASEIGPNFHLYLSLSLFYILIIEADSVSKMNLSQFVDIISEYNNILGYISANFLTTNISRCPLLSASSNATQPGGQVVLYSLLFHLQQSMQYQRNLHCSSVIIQMFDVVNRPNSYLPTMPQDDEFEALQSVRHGQGGVTQYYLCPNGHRYGVGDCGQLNQSSTCNECGEIIGRNQRGPVPLLRQYQDNTQPGHILGTVQNENAASVPIRDLSALHATLLRFVLHGVMFVATIDNGPDSVASCIKPSTSDVREFLLKHLELNFSQITRTLGQNEDATIVLLHSVILSMTNSNFQLQGSLGNKLERRQWEASFGQRVLTPCVHQLRERLPQFQNSLQQDSVSGESVLFDILSKKDLESDNSEGDIPFHSSFWHYRQRLTLDNLEQWIDTNDVSDGFQLSTTCPKLYYLMTNREILSCTPTLISIINLQIALVRLLSGRLDKQEIAKLSIRKLLFQKIQDSRQREILKNQIEDYLHSLSKLHSHVFQNDRYGRAAQSYINSEGSINLTRLPRDVTEWPAAILFPCNEGYGLCAKVMVSVLVGAHNAAVAQGQLGPDALEDRIVNVTQISADSIVAFMPEQLHLLLLSNSRYDLHVAQQSTKAHIDLESLERQVVDRYFGGRPRISHTKDIPVFHFASPTSLWTPSSTPLIGVIPQQPLPVSLRHQLESELTNLPELCDLLSLLQTTRDLLRILPGEPDSSVLSNMRRLGIQNDASPTAVPDQDRFGRLRFLNSNPCPSLRHIDHLIEMLQLLRSRRMLSRRQNPWFEILPVSMQESLPEAVTATVLITLMHSISGPVLLDRLHFFIMNGLANAPTETVVDASDTDAQLMKPDWSLGMTLTPFLEDHDIPDAELFELEIPDIILVKHAASCFEAVDKILNDRNNF